MIAKYRGHAPGIDENAFIAANAVIVGRVVVHADASVWYGAVIRGDIEPITIGPQSNIQDNCTLHTDTGFPLKIGRNVSVGHNAVLHGCTIEDDCLIGIGAVILNGAHVKRGSVVAAGSVVREGQVVGPLEMVAGTPAATKKRLDENSLKPFLQPVRDYLDHMKGHREIEIPE